MTVKDNTRCNELRQEVDRCHQLLDDAGIPTLEGEPNRLFKRVSRLTAEYTLGAVSLRQTMKDLEEIAKKLEGGHSGSED